jgi:3-oxoacyl-[acyl-carrier-protein] synthase-1
MSSTVSACLATNFKVKGINYSITSACSTSAHCIGAAAQQIAWGMQDVMFAGGGEELSWGMSLLFDGMGAMSSKYNETPEKASRAYDANRDGFVIAGGGGAVVLESLDMRWHAVPTSWPKWWALAPPATVRTWSLLRATAPSPA